MPLPIIHLGVTVVVGGVVVSVTIAEKLMQTQCLDIQGSYQREAQKLDLH